MNLKLISILILIVLALGATIVFQQGRITKLKTDHDQAVKFALSDEQDAKWYKNKNEQLTMKVNLLELSNKNIKELRESDRLNFLQQFEGVKKNLRNVEQSMRMEAEFKGSWPILVDTAGRFNHIDKFNSVSGLVTKDTVVLSVVATVPIQGAIIWQRRKFLGLRIGKKEYAAHITSLNPNVTIVQYEIIKVSKAK